MINLIDKTAIDENRILELAEQYIYNILPDKEDVNNRLAFFRCSKIYIFTTV